MKRPSNLPALRPILCTLGLCFLAIASASVQADDEQDATWRHFGQNLSNDRHQASEMEIGPDNVADLEVLWETNIRALGGGDVWQTAAVDEEAVYFPDGAGNLWSLDRETGAVRWQRPISDYSSKPAFNFSRTTPAVQGNTLVIGDQANRFPIYNFANQSPVADPIGAEVMAVNKNTGEPLWTTEVDQHPFSLITSSPTIFGNKVIVGVSSYESAYAFFEGTLLPFGYEPDSNGSLLALDLNTGEILWQTFFTTEDFSGASVWGSSPAIDPSTNQVFVGTGQNFDAPQSVLDCASSAYAGVDPTDRDAAAAAAEAARGCLEVDEDGDGKPDYADNLFDSIIALDLDTGEINWANRIVGYDVWHVACLFGIPSCPSPFGADADFGQSPIFFRLGDMGRKRSVIGAGQKSGIYWLLDAITGEVIWSTRVSPGGIAGGLQWGSAYDGEYLYLSSANSNNLEWTLIDGTVTRSGIWSALDPATGEIIWQTAAPGADASGAPAKAGGPASVANGVVYVCGWDADGTMYGLRATTGEILWSYPSGGTCNSGAAISNGTLFWGSGYAGNLGPIETSSDYFRAFALPDDN
jgi:polyvinyl alcohol dehydrogenase (cytochrome)